MSRYARLSAVRRVEHVSERLIVTIIEIESSQKRTTGEAIVGVGGFAIRVGIHTPGV